MEMYVWKPWSFTFTLPHISLSQGECVWVFLLLSFIPSFFYFCLVISLINLSDEHKVRVVTLSMNFILFFLPSFAWTYSYFLFVCLVLFIVRSWGSLITLVLLLLFCLFYEEFSPRILHNVMYHILMD